MIFTRIAIILCLSIQAALAAEFMKGKVTMENGSAPPGRVVIQRVCPGAGALTEATTNKEGHYLWRVLNNMQVVCVLQAVLAGYESNKIDTSLDRIYFSLDLPTLILHPISSEPQADASSKLPRAAAKSWNLAMKALNAKKWEEAERLLRMTVHAVPDFASAWNALGAACQHQQKDADARDAYQHAINVDPSSLLAYLNLTRLEIGSQHWPEALKAAEALIRADTGHRYLEAYLDDVIARYALHDLDGVEATLNMALQLDTRRQLPRLEYFMGAVLGAKGQPESGAEPGCWLRPNVKGDVQPVTGPPERHT
jgi:tetratricopeptide (TPR) repeat protein